MILEKLLNLFYMTDKLYDLFLKKKFKILEME